MFNKLHEFFTNKKVEQIENILTIKQSHYIDNTIQLSVTVDYDYKRFYVAKDLEICENHTSIEAINAHLAAMENEVKQMVKSYVLDRG